MSTFQQLFCLRRQQSRDDTVLGNKKVLDNWRAEVCLSASDRKSSLFTQFHVP
ncbi:hypothetical protein NC651_021669 [Populus alba x Populus x berolinensis]|nr:hypothetical protein NC651_021669 [Populus alba x Populus x berolinensis]